MFTVSNKENAEGQWQDITLESYEKETKARKEFWKMVSQYVKLKPEYSFEVKLTNPHGRILEKIEKL